MREKIQSLKADRRGLEAEKLEANTMVKNLQEKLLLEQEEFRKREDEWKAVNQGAHEASRLLTELRTNAQIQAAHSTQLSNELRELQLEKIKLEELLQDKQIEQTSFGKEINELRFDKEKLLTKLSKRETKLKDVRKHFCMLYTSRFSGGCDD